MSCILYANTNPAIGLSDNVLHNKSRPRLSGYHSPDSHPASPANPKLP